MFDSVPPIAIAIAGGVLPALGWLWFWLREDRVHPEPRRLIALAFLTGMITVMAVIPVQKSVEIYLGIGTMLTFAAWAIIEECGKYIAARFSVLDKRENDEPIDAVVYMVTVALGFAAVENALFLLNPTVLGHISTTILTSDLRAIGATLLHIVASSAIGVALAFGFYKNPLVRFFYAIGGVILAALLHTGFNFLILHTKDEQVLRTFAFVWFSVLVLLGILEFVKRIRRPVRAHYSK